MEKKRQRVIGKRTVKYKELAESLKKEKQESEASFLDKSDYRKLIKELDDLTQELKEMEIPEKKEKMSDNAEQKPGTEAETTEEMTPEKDVKPAVLEPISAEIKKDEQEADEPELISETKEKTSQIEETEPVESQEETDIPEPSGNSRKQIIIIATIGFLLVGIYVLWGRIKNPKEVKPEPEPIEETETISLSMPAEYKDEWLRNKAINHDYIGNIIFDSGLIDLPIVQATDVYDRNGNLYTFYTEEGQLVEDVEDYTGNDVYIWTNWKTREYDPYGDGGSVFMDFRNNLKDQNLIIYGHHFARDFDPSGSKQFTPLDALLEEENYETNKTLKLILNNEIREYAIANVFVIDIDNEYELNIMRKNMNEDYSGNPDPGFYEKFISYMNSISRYDTGEQLSEDSRILTLVTCIQHQPQYRQIIICKETERTLYE